MSIEIKYNNEILVDLDAGKVATIPCNGKKMQGDIVITTPKTLGGSPIAVDNIDNIVVTEKNNGKIYGCNNRLYKASKITSLKGLTIKFNESISPCTIIGEEEELECSGVFYDAFRSVYTYTNEVNVAAIRRNVYGTQRSISFSVHGNDAYDGEVYPFNFADVFYDGSWQVLDENGNQYETSSLVITNFDCPVLNENTSFISWVMLNAKVYQKIESIKDIQSFAFSKNTTLSKVNYFISDIISAMAYIYNIYTSSTNIDGTYATSFSIGEEVINKTFSNMAVSQEEMWSGIAGAKVIVFSSNASDDVLTFELPEDANNFESDIIIMKYNDVVLDSGLTFTQFDMGIFNTSYYILNCILCDVVINDSGITLKELITPNGTLEITNNGETNVTNYAKANVNVVDNSDGISEEIELMIVRGEY